MAEIVGVSLSTILFQLSVSSECTTISDAELDNIILDIDGDVRH